MEFLFEYRDAIQVAQRDRQLRRLPIDLHFPKKLKPGKRRGVLRRRGLFKHHLRAEGFIQRVGPKAPRIQRPRDELPERLEILERCPIRVVVMRRAVMHIGSQPHIVAHLLRA